MRDYDLTPRAVRDIVSACDWYEREKPDLGNYFFDAVLRAIREARERPERFPKVNRSIRSVGLIDFPYRVYYATKRHRIIIRAVYHTHRNPRRWADEERD